MFEIKDIFNEPVSLTRDVWTNVVRKHPEVDRLEREIKLTIFQPDKVVKSVYDERVNLYYKYFAKIFKGKLLVVVVKRLSYREKYVTTVYITDKRKGGEIIWPKN